MKRRRRSGGRLAAVVFGIVAIVAGSIWSLLWGMVALLASGFGSDPAGWLLVCGMLAVGIAMVASGIFLVRRRSPGRRGWIVVVVAVVAPFALAIGPTLDERAARPVEGAVERAYAKRHGQKTANADCARAAENPNGSEWWVCDIELPFDFDTCNVTVTNRPGGGIHADIDYCLNEDLGQ